MRMAYLFMKYPMGVQPYAISDVRALEADGHRVDIYAISTPSRDHDAAVETYALELGPRSQWSWRTIAAVLDPRNLPITAALLGLVIPKLLTRPRELAVSLALAPRIIEVTALLRRDPPDVVHAFWGHFPSLIMPLAERFLPTTHRSLALTAYDLTSHLFSLSGEISARCDSVWTLADENVAILERIGAPMDRVHVVYRGVPMDLAAAPAPAKEPGLICTAANFQKEKNMDIVLRSFAAARARAPHARLVMMGDGQERRNLEEIAERLGLGESVTFTGLLPREQLFDVMRRSEIFLFLSTKVSERLPNVVMEAMLARCVPVVSRTSGIETLVDQGRSGFIEDDLTPSVVADRLIAVLAAADMKAIGDRAEKHIRERFSAQAAMRAYADVWADASSTAWRSQAHGVRQLALQARGP